jgi:hypothetical protein
MVSISKKNGEFIFNIMGWHKIWAFVSKINIPEENIVLAYQNEEELKSWSGWRIPGTYIPYWITAGTFYRKGNRNFWDVMNTKKTIIVELKDSFYNKLYIEVENPEETVQLLNSK